MRQLDLGPDATQFPEIEMNMSSIPPMPPGPPELPQGPAPGVDLLGGAAVGVKDEHALITRLLEQEVHPVLVFGTSYSGKTCMLMSLIAYARSRSDAGINVQLGDPVFPPGYPEAMDRFNQAKIFYNDYVVSFLSGRTAGNTRLNHHFFIPLDVTYTRPGCPPETRRYAFMEGMGGWFGLKQGSSSDFEPLQPEVRALLERYPESISALFLAPSVPSALPDGEYGKAHQALTNCMDEYVRRRGKTHGGEDNLLLLGTHWDRAHPPGTRPNAFAASSAEEMAKIMGGWMSWTTFSSMQVPAARAAMPYSSGLINDDGQIVNDPGDMLRPVFDRFNQTLWNWLYANAAPASSSAPRRSLFPELSVSRPLSPMERLVGKLLWEWRLPNRGSA
jgi:hypothetical protein